MERFEMIPKVIHYCWFGKGDKPDDVVSYINSWRDKLPDFKIIEWNENNFDVESIPYVKQAYSEKKFAFVSDYVRLHALFNHGGVYLDTDVEVVQDLTPMLLCSDVVLGFEEFDYIATSTIIAKQYSKLIHEFMCTYHKLSFYNSDNTLDLTTNVVRLSSFLKSAGVRLSGNDQDITFDDESVKIFNKIIFSPYDYSNYIDYRNENTYTVHHYGNSWQKRRVFKKFIKKVIINLIGPSRLNKLKNNKLNRF